MKKTISKIISYHSCCQLQSRIFVLPERETFHAAAEALQVKALEKR